MIPALSNNLGDFFLGFWNSTGISAFFSDGGWKNLIMIAIACLLLYLAIWKKAEPYLLIPMGIGMLLVNLPLSGIFETSYVDMAGNALSAPILKEVHYSGLLGLVYPNGEMVVDTTQCSATYSGLLGTLYYGIKF